MKISGGLAQLLRVVATLAFICASGLLNSAATAQLSSLRVVDYATMPMTGIVNGTNNNSYLARVNFLADEPTDAPGGSTRFFVNDLNGPLYILDKATKSFTQYLNFNGRDGLPGMFPEFVYSTGFANGLITFQFDPAYQTNGKFYTVHMEEPAHISGSFGPDNTNVPGLNTTGYTTTPSVTTPGGSNRSTVLVEWTDTNSANTTFEGTARELLRVNMSGQIHPMGDLIFNPTAEEGDPDWRVMYISIGDGGAGESGNVNTRRTPQLLNTLGGKVLRIIPDLTEHVATSTPSPNGRYRIPNDNPFLGVAGSSVRDEIWALGMRNPHRMSWDVDPNNPDVNTNNRLIVNDIGLHTWEEVNFIKKGVNYGYSDREGPQLLGTDNEADDPPPNPDTVLKDLVCTGSMFNTCTNGGTVTPQYPVVAYGHDFADSTYIGDSISSGYVYRGSKIPELYGKYLFGEITTGQIFYADYAAMIAADDGNPNTMATISSLNIRWDDPNAPGGEQVYLTTTSGGVLGPMFQIIEKTYEFRGGQDPNLPGGASVTGSNGRADIRIQIGEDGELYILSKSDGMIRQLVGYAKGDYNRDWDIDADDYTLWRQSFGNTVASPGLLADGNGDGVIDLGDYVVWRDAMPTAGASAFLLNIPEPASGMMLTLASIIFLGRRRRRAR